MHEVRKQAVIIKKHRQTHIKGGTSPIDPTDDSYIGSIDTDSF